MRVEAKYSGTLQLKELAEYRLAECIQHNLPEKVVIWTEAVQYFERQLQTLGWQIEQAKPTIPSIN